MFHQKKDGKVVTTGRVVIWGDGKEPHRQKVRHEMQRAQKVRLLCTTSSNRATSTGQCRAQSRSSLDSGRR